MTFRQYITAFSMIVMGVVFTPDWSELLKVYVISVVVLVTAAINLLFKITWLRRYIVERLISDAIIEIFKDRDVQKLIEWSQARERAREHIREEVKKRESFSARG